MARKIQYTAATQTTDHSNDTGNAYATRFLRSLKRGGALFQVLPAAVDQAEAANLDITVSSAQVRSNEAQLAELRGEFSEPAVFASLYRLGAARSPQLANADR